jgi:type VI secretion system secreted protein Hcp
MGIYWKMKTATGDATEKNHTNWMRINAFAFRSGRSVTTRTGRVADREVSTGHVSQLSITKGMDSASMDLFMSTCLGGGEEMQINVTRAGSRADKSEITFLKYTLSDALLTGYDLQVGRDGRVQESLTVDFTKVVMRFTPQDSAAKGLAGVPVTFDMATGTGEGA